MKPKKRVALAFPTGIPHFRRVVRGIADYAKDHGGWTFSTSPETFSVSIDELKGWQGDGVIAEVDNRSQARAAERLGVPVVNVSGALRSCKLPRVTADNRTIGRLAAEHLLERGFQRFGYYGVQGVWYSQLRQRGFEDRVGREGRDCNAFEAPSSLGRQHWAELQEPLEQWLTTLRLPVGVMAVHDGRAAMMVEACTRLGLRVPDDVAAVGVNDDAQLCQLARPTLSSVARNDEETGRRLATLLDRLMTGEKPPARDVLVPPVAVVERRSTDVLAVDDPYVAIAVRYVRDNIHEPFNVSRLALLVPISRRWLEHRFQQCLGELPHDFISRMRVERAKRYLTAPEKRSLYKIAASCGFNDARRFRVVFQRVVGVTPAEYRQALAANDNTTTQ